MPTPKTKRDIVLLSSFSATDTVATLSLGVDAQFTTPSGTVTANLFEDSSSGSSDEATEYQMSFGPVGGAQIGVLTMSFTGSGAVQARGLSVAKTSATSEFDPSETTGTVTPIPGPDAQYSRTWQQPALNGTTQLVDQLGGVDVRVKAGNGYRVTQTVTSNSVAQLVLSYTWRTPRGAEVMSGTVTFTAGSVAGAGYSLGTATVSDNAPTGTGTRAGAGARNR